MDVIELATYAELQTIAIKFAKHWKNETSEAAEAHTCWVEFFAVFGHDRRQYAIYEQTVKKLRIQGVIYNTSASLFDGADRSGVCC